MDQLAVDLPLVVVLLGAVIGASLNVLRGYKNSGEVFDFKAFGTALITALMAGVATAVLIPIPDTAGGVVGLFVAGMFAGFGTDFLVTKGKQGLAKAKMK